MPKFRFSINRLMLLVAVAAGVAWVYRSVNSYAFVALLVCGALIVGQASTYYFGLKAHPRRAWRVFVGSSLVAVVGFGVLGVIVQGMIAGMINVPLSVFLLPIPLGSGLAWVKGAIGDEPVVKRRRFFARVLVLGVVGLTLSMVFARWPMRVAFLVSRPALDRLADRIEVGDIPRWPVRAGLFQVGGIARGHAGTANIALMIGTDFTTNTWFVRASPATPDLVIPAQVFVSEKLTDDGRWWFQEED